MSSFLWGVVTGSTASVFLTMLLCKYSANKKRLEQLDKLAWHRWEEELNTKLLENNIGHLFPETGLLYVSTGFPTYVRNLYSLGLSADEALCTIVKMHKQAEKQQLVSATSSDDMPSISYVNGTANDKH